MEAFDIAFDDAYGNPPLSKDAPQHLDATYSPGRGRMSLQLSRAGVHWPLCPTRRSTGGWSNLDIGPGLRYRPTPGYFRS
jgi:hypothetical protein